MDNENGGAPASEQGEDFQIEDADLLDVPDFTDEQLADEKFDVKAELKKQTGIAKRRTTALRKAKEALGKAPKPAVAKPSSDAAKKGGLDYGQKAFLASAHDVKDAEDVAFIEKAMKDSGNTLEDVMSSTFVQGKLKEMQEFRATKAAAPDNGDRSGGAPAGAKNTVEYWIKAGQLPPNTPENQDLRRKVVQAKRDAAAPKDPFKAGA